MYLLHHNVAQPQHAKWWQCTTNAQLRRKREDKDKKDNIIWQLELKVKRLKVDDDGTKSFELKGTQPSNLRDYIDFDLEKGFPLMGVWNDGVFQSKPHSLWDLKRLRLRGVVVEGA